MTMFTYLAYGAGFHTVCTHEIPAVWHAEISGRDERRMGRRLRGYKMPSCVVCGQPSSGKCESCRVTHYCGGVCQKHDWPKHRLVCGQRSEIEHHLALEIPESLLSWAYQRWQFWQASSGFVPVCIVNARDWQKNHGMEATAAVAKIARIGRPLLTDNWIRISAIASEVSSV